MKKGLIIIADDIDMSRHIIKKFLKDDYDVLEACNGKEVLLLLQDNKPDAILLDIVMPEMDGLEALSKIKENSEWDNIAILMATSTKEKTERIALLTGADDIVAKPYDPVVIKKRLDNILAKKAYEKISSFKKESKEMKEYFSNKYALRVCEQISKINQYTRIIKENKENISLLEEYSNDIINALQEIEDLFKDS